MQLDIFTICYYTYRMGCINGMCGVGMVDRNYWKARLERAWEDRSVIWLAGVRRSGKTYLCKSLDGVEYFDCELPRIRQLMEDPEDFLNSIKGKRVVLDEIHRLENPSELLKIAADYHSDTKVVATGSSTLDAFRKFRDSLTGRKVIINFTPILLHESEAFPRKSLRERMLYGGLPAFYLSGSLPEGEYQDWLHSYWAKDVQELFYVEKRHSFMKFTELLLAQSGSIFEATRFASACEVSRKTIMNYLAMLEITFVVRVIRPYSTHAATEIVSAAKVYGFDTGFVCHCRGWINLRQEDLGQLWEHLVLNEIIGRGCILNINYWRDRQGHEIDFVLSRRGVGPIVVECKWSSTNFDAKNIKVFRRRYPDGKNYVVANDVDREYEKDFDGVKVSFVSPEMLVDAVVSS